jgi:PAS domain S-box
MANDSQKTSSNDPGRAEGLSLDNGLDYRIIFNATSNGMAFTEFDSGIIIDVNADWIRSTGIVCEKAIGRTAFELGLWGSQAEREACYAELDKKGRIVDFEARLIMKSAELPHLISGKVIEISGKRYVLWEFRDMTERKQAEELFRTLAANSPVGVYIVQNGKFVYTNLQFQRDSGYREDELLGMEALSMVLPEDREAVRNNAIQMLKEKRVVPYEFRTINKNGEMKWHLESALPIQYQGKQAAIGSYQDITERKQTEEALRFTNTILLTQQEASLDGIVVVDKQGEMILFNQRFVDMWGIPDEVVKSKSGSRVLRVVLDKLIEPKKFVERVNYLFEHHQEKSYDEVMLPGDIIFELYSTPIVGEDGAYYGRVWYFRDITERKNAEEEREKLIGELSVSLEKVKTLSGLLPICASCKKIRDDKGYWHQIEAYIRDHSDVEFSHGICTECMKKLYPDFKIE